jgi:hypothetical protein
LVTERVLPEADRYATCPTDGPVLDYYKGTFESVYVLLHPFIRPVSIDPETFKPATYPDRKTIAETCKPVSWAQVLELSGLASVASIDIGLRTQIGALTKEYSNADFADRLEGLYESHRIIPPDEGHFSDLLHDRVLDFLENLGHKWVWVGDEFCTTRRLFWIDDLRDKEADATLGHCNVFTPDKSMLWTTHWDSCCSFVCGRRDVLSAMAAKPEFEGFFCTSKTKVYWSAGET